jgi:hypothetical protein
VIQFLQRHFGISLKSPNLIIFAKPERSDLQRLEDVADLNALAKHYWHWDLESSSLPLAIAVQLTAKML